MPEPLTYEVYIRRGQEWFVENASDCKETALEEAQRLYDAHVSTAVKVIEERFSADTGESSGATIFFVDRNRPPQRGARPTARARPLRERPVGKAVNYKPKRVKAPAEIFLQRLTLLVLVAGGLTLSLLVSLAHLLDYML